jgi:alpha-galactosidase
MLCCSLAFSACAPDLEVYRVDSGHLALEFDSRMYSRVLADLAGPSNIETQFSASEFIIADGIAIKDFALTETVTSETTDQLGHGIRHTLSGESAGRIEKRVEITSYDKFPDMISMRVDYKNNSPEPITISKWVSDAHTIADAADQPAFWSFQGASYEDRRDWVMPLTVGFSQQNYLGMNATDYGNGTPVSDVWRKDAGLAVGHLETVPKLVSLPVRYPDQERGAEVSVEYEYDFEVAPGESISTIETFIFVHKGDYYAALKNYRHVMAMKGLKIADAPESAYEAIWCAWGYERNFNVTEVLNTLPKAKELGLKWAVLDDGWQTAEGDWYLNPEKFPRGTPDMQALVSNIKEAGLKAKLWWTPLAVDPGTDLIKNHEDMLLLNEDGTPQKITWWDSYYLCPAYDKTIEYSKNLVKTFMKDWGFQGLKIDGQHLNGVPKCYNPKHHHARPEESVEKLQTFWQEIYETALSIDKEAVVEICPCGTAYAFFNLPYMNQTVASDPLSSWQVRLKGKTLKALAGESAAYYGDHVELSDEQNDFASTIGVGAVVGTKFTLPSNNADAAKELLTPEKEALWRKWIGIYNEKMLPKGEYLGELYDIGFDLPETHAIRKDGAVFYAFYANTYDGDVELRGLESRKYKLIDYVDDTDLGIISGPTAKIRVNFVKHLLVEATPVDLP